MLIGAGCGVMGSMWYGWPVGPHPRPLSQPWCWLAGCVGRGGRGEGVDGDWGGLRCDGVDGVGVLFVAGGKNVGQYSVHIAFDCLVADA